MTDWDFKNGNSGRVGPPLLPTPLIDEWTSPREKIYQTQERVIGKRKRNISCFSMKIIGLS